MSAILFFISFQTNEASRDNQRPHYISAYIACTPPESFLATFSSPFSPSKEQYLLRYDYCFIMIRLMRTIIVLSFEYPPSGTQDTQSYRTNTNDAIRSHGDDEGTAIPTQIKKYQIRTLNSQSQK